MNGERSAGIKDRRRMELDRFIARIFVVGLKATEWPCNRMSLSRELALIVGAGNALLSAFTKLQMS